jgi:TonB family protein
MKTGCAASAARREDHLMIESAIRAERVELPSSPATFYLWDVPQKPVCVKVPFALIDRLEHEAVESFRSLSSRGSEIGGVLLGGVSPGSPAIVTLQDFELIACEYARGPLFRLSDVDLERFDRTFAQHTAAGRTVVGFFRSHTRKGIQLDPEDITLLDSRFSAAHHIALLIRPFATKPSVAGIFIREDGVFRIDASHKEFPFRSSQLTALAPNQEPAQAPSPAAPPPPPAAAPAAKPPARAQIVPIASRRDTTPAAIPEPVPAPAPPPVAVEPPPPVEARAVAPPAEPAAPPKVEKTPSKVEKEAPKSDKEPSKPETKADHAGKESVKPAPEPAPAPEQPALQSFAEPESRGGKLLWIVTGTAVALILGVVLFVYPGFLIHRDNNTAATAPADSSALELRVQRSGGDLVLIWNRDSDVVRKAAGAVLSISDGDRQENAQLDIDTLRSGTITYTPATGDVVFKLEVTGKDQAKTSSALVRALQMRPSPMPPAGDQAAATQPATAPTPAAEAPAPAPAPAEEAPAKAPERQLRQFRTESLAQRLRPSNPVELPDAPTVGGAQAPGASPISSLNISAAVPAPPSAQPKAAPAPPPPAPKAVTSGGNIVQAVLISKKEPEYPKIARDAGAKGIVELIATIGTDGRVKTVKVLRGHPMLQKSASDAVMQWVYKPTLLNGIPVEGQVQVAVNFLGR